MDSTVSRIACMRRYEMRMAERGSESLKEEEEVGVDEEREFFMQEALDFIAMCIPPEITEIIHSPIKSCVKKELMEERRTEEDLAKFKKRFVTLNKSQQLLDHCSESRHKAVEMLSATGSPKLKTFEKISNLIGKVMHQGDFKNLPRLVKKYIGFVLVTKEIKKEVLLSRHDIKIWRKLAFLHRPK